MRLSCVLVESISYAETTPHAIKFDHPQRQLFDWIMQGRAPINADEQQETLRDVARLSPDEITAERQWYGLADLPLNHSSSSLAQAAQYALGFDEG